VAKLKNNFPAEENYRYRVEVSDDGINCNDQSQNTKTEKTQELTVIKGSNGRFLRIIFVG